MRIPALLLLMLLSTMSYAQELEVQTRPDSIYVERMSGDLTPLERVFFHIILHNLSPASIDIQAVRFSFVSSAGATLSGQYSGQALMSLFDSAIDRRRIEPTTKGTLTLGADQRKAISDIFLDCPAGFIGDSLLVEIDYKAGDQLRLLQASLPLNKSPAFAGRLPFEGTWYVASEHGSIDTHKRFLAEAFAYDFLQVGQNGKSYQRDGSRNADYYAYGKRVLAVKEGSVVFVKTDVLENLPGATNFNTPGGNVVILDHGNNQYSYYAHLKPNTVLARMGATIRAGDPIGEVGNSGDSLEPHLHFHVMNGPDPAQADGVPAVFTNWKTQAYGRAGVLREMGILPRGEFVEP